MTSGKGIHQWTVYIALECKAHEAYVIHLVSDELQPILASLDACNHISQLSSDDCLRIERLSEYDALIRPFETLFDYSPLCAEAGTCDHPPLMVEIAQNDLHALPDLSQGVRDWDTGFIECDIGRSRC